MRYFPVNLDLQQRPVVVIGGGTVATRKVRTLVEAGARVRVVAPEIHPILKKLVRSGKVRVSKRPYRPGDLSGAFAAIAATDDRKLHLKIRREATVRRVLLNIVDKPEFCDYVFPSRLNRGEFMLTISTGGASPALSKRIRQQLERQFGHEYGQLVSLLGKIRQSIPVTERKKYQTAFSQFVRSPILAILRRKDRTGTNRLVEKYFGHL